MTTKIILPDINLPKRNEVFRSRIAIGARDVENNTIEVARVDTLTKKLASREGIADYILHYWLTYSGIYIKRHLITETV